MEKKWIAFLLLTLMVQPAFLHAEDKEKAAAAVAANANAASENALGPLDGAADNLDDFALEDEDLIMDEDLALDEDLEEANFEDLGLEAKK